MIVYIDAIKAAAPAGLIVTAAKSKINRQDGTITEYDTICCECGPHSLSFQPLDAETDSKIIIDWWKKTARYPLIIAV